MKSNKQTNNQEKKEEVIQVIDEKIKKTFQSIYAVSPQFDMLSNNRIQEFGNFVEILEACNIPHQNFTQENFDSLVIELGGKIDNDFINGMSNLLRAYIKTISKLFVESDDGSEVTGKQSDILINFFSFIDERVISPEQKEALISVINHYNNPILHKTYVLKEDKTIDNFKSFVERYLRLGYVKPHSNNQVRKNSGFHKPINTKKVIEVSKETIETDMETLRRYANNCKKGSNVKIIIYITPSDATNKNTSRKEKAEK